LLPVQIPVEDLGDNHAAGHSGKENAPL